MSGTQLGSEQTMVFGRKRVFAAKATVGINHHVLYSSRHSDAPSAP